MGVYGPFNASLNTVVTVTGIDPNADRLFIDNQSKYTLAIGFADTPPPAILSLLGTPWYAEVPPGGKTVQIPYGAYGGQHFPGYFYVLALDALSSARAYTGTTSANTAFFVAALLASEASPPDYAIPQSTDLSSQPRLVTVPMLSDSSGLNPGQFGNPGVAASTNFGGLNFVSGFVGHTLTWILYKIRVSPYWVVAGAGGIDFTISLDLQTAGNVSLGVPFPIVFFRDFMWWSANTFDRFVWDGPPIGIPIFIPTVGSPDHITLVFKNLSATNAPAFFDFSFISNVDVTNNGVIPGLISQINPAPARF